jgi:alpha-tubulin suppressor-like RCC1 family protein
VVQVRAGVFHTCALDGAGVVSCWGYNVAGQTNVPARVRQATQVSAGGRHTCVLDGAGVVTCWGDDTQGQTKGFQ